MCVFACFTSCVHATCVCMRDARGLGFISRPLTHRSPRANARARTYRGDRYIQTNRKQFVRQNSESHVRINDTLVERSVVYLGTRFSRGLWWAPFWRAQRRRDLCSDPDGKAGGKRVFRSQSNTRPRAIMKTIVTNSRYLHARLSASSRMPTSRGKGRAELPPAKWYHGLTSGNPTHLLGRASSHI